jgi:uncharacterized protein (DUF433 family)
MKLDLRNYPAYSICETAGILRLPDATVRAWVLGQPRNRESGFNGFAPVITIADKRGKHLSFVNLVELHVLSAIRNHHKVSLPKVRSALIYVGKHFNSIHPLADADFQTDGLDLFIKEFDQLLNASQHGQLAIKSVMEAHLKRIERDAKGVPIKLFPFTRRGDPDEPKFVEVDPRKAYGKPVLYGTGIPTSILAERFQAGDSMSALASDYGKPIEQIEEAIRYEPKAA